MKKLLIYVLLASFAFGQGQVLQEASVAQAAAGTAGAGYYISPRRQGGGTGSPGTVTSVSVTPTATVTGTVTNATTTPAIELTAITNPSPSGSNLVAGGSVAFVSNLTLTVAAATYVIQGVQYSSPITTLTASAADPTFDRIDIVAVNSSGAAVLIEGTPAASPVAPDVDPASQLGLTFYILAAGATSIPVSVTDIYHNNAEWTMSRSGTTWTLASTNNPYTGSVCIEGTAVATGNSFTATAPGDIDLADHDNLIFYIRNKAAWASTRQISIQWLNNSNVVKGTLVTLKNGSYGFNALTNTTAYQQIAIPLSAFGANGLAVRKLRFQLAGTGATIGAYVDDITLQGGLAPVVDTTKMQWRGPYNASNLYNINDVVISGSIQYVAIAAGVGHTPASSTTYWQPSSAAPGTGTVTAVSVASANGFTGTSSGGTTPALTIIAGDITPTSVITTGINSAAGASIEVANAMAALAIDVTKGLNTKTIAVDSTFTFSGTPANSNQGFSLRLTNSDTNNHVITIPSTFDSNAQATTTSFTILAGGIETITWVYNGSSYIGYNIPSPAYSAEITVASATTTNIGAAASVNVAISGTTAITGFGTVAAGTYRQGRFTGILTFTHNGTSLILPNAGSNITTAANDRFGAYSLGSGNWLVLWYQRADGTSLAGGGGGSGTVNSGTANQVAYYASNGTAVSGSASFTSNISGGVLAFAPATTAIVRANAAAAGVSSIYVLTLNGTDKAQMDAAGATDAVVTGSATGDMVFRTEGGSMLFGTNSSSSYAMKIAGSNGLITSPTGVLSFGNTVSIAPTSGNAESRINPTTGNNGYFTLQINGTYKGQVGIAGTSNGVVSGSAVGDMGIRTEGGAILFCTDAGVNIPLKINGSNGTIVATTGIVPSQTAGIVGTTTNNNANAGSVGESSSSNVAVGSAVSLSNGTAANITSISLTAGDWDLSGIVSFNETTATVTARSAGITTTSATVPSDGSEGYCGVQSTVTSEKNSITLARQRLSVASTTTVYLVGSASFSAGTCSGFGQLAARRVR